MKLNITTIQFLFYVVLAAGFYSFAQEKSLAEAKLVIDSFSPHKDSIISIGVLINLKDDWHIYWRNPGDSGLPTEIDFTLPEGISVSEIKYPVPEIFYTEEIVDYGYSHQVLLIADLQIPKDYLQKEINISAKITSLICKEFCKSFSTTVTCKLNLSEDYKAEKNISDLFEKTKILLPVINHKLKLSAIKKTDQIFLKLDKDNTDISIVESLKFYPYQAGYFRNKINQENNISENGLELVLELDPFRTNDPAEVEGIILINNVQTEAYEINIPIKN